MSKRLYNILFVTLVTLSFLSCERGGEDLYVDEDVVGTVSFSASCSDDSTSTRVANNLWESSDFIGLWTSDDSETKNMCYAVGASGTMTNTDEDYTIEVVGSKSYYAYYPYESAVASSDGIKTIDLTDQRDLTSDEFNRLDFMWTKQEDVGVYQSLVYLLFQRQLVHLDITLCLRSESYDQTKGVTIDGVKLGATFDIKTGVMSYDDTSSTQCKAYVSSVENHTVSDPNGDNSADYVVVRAEAMVLPMSQGDITVSYYDMDGNIHQSTITPASDYKSGVSYNYSITNYGYEIYYLSDIKSGSYPMGDIWVICDSGTVTEAEFATLRSNLTQSGSINVHYRLFFPNLTVLPTGALTSCNWLEGVYMPHVTTIGSSALSGCYNLAEVYAPELEYVSSYALEGCSALTSIDNLTNIYMAQEGAFSNCTTLSTVQLDNLSYAGDSAFSSCVSLTDFDAHNLAWVGKQIFSNCDKLNTVKIGYDLTTTGITNLEYGWVDSSRTSLIELVISATLPTGVSISGNQITYATGDTDTFVGVENQAWTLSEITATNMPTSEDGWVIADSSATSSSSFLGLKAALATLSTPITLAFPMLDALPDGALDGAENIETIFMSKVTTLGSSSLANIASLSSVTLGLDGEGVSSIGDGWIGSVDSESIDLVIKTNSESLTVAGNLLKIDSGATQYFNTINGSGFTLAMFNAIVDDTSSYPSGNDWVITDSGSPSYTEFDSLNSVIDDCGRKINLTFPNLESLPNSAMSGVSNLYSISLPVATSVHYGALFECVNLVTVSMPYVTNISNSVFAFAISLESVYLPRAMVIGASLFQRAYNLKSIDLGSLTSISSFNYNCFETMNLDEVTLTICRYSKLPSGVSISKNSLVFVIDDPLSTLESTSYDFNSIIQK